MNIPNVLTLLRIALIPIFILTFYIPFNNHYVVTGILFAIAAITDWFDGYLARRLHQYSSFGAFLDPVADKLLVVVGLTLLVEVHSSFWLSLPALIIIGREVTISALREWMSTLGEQQKVAVSSLGKLKTTIQMIAISLLLGFPEGPLFFMLLGFTLLYGAVFLTIWTMIQYLKAAKIFP